MRAGPKEQRHPHQNGVSSQGERFSTFGVRCLALPSTSSRDALVKPSSPLEVQPLPPMGACPVLHLFCPRLRPVKEMSQTHEYLSIEYSEEEVWLTWTDKNNDHHEKSIRQLAQEARAGNAHDENVLSYYR